MRETEKISPNSTFKQAELLRECTSAGTVARAPRDLPSGVSAPTPCFARSSSGKGWKSCRGPQVASHALEACGDPDGHRLGTPRADVLLRRTFGLCRGPQSMRLSKQRSRQGAVAWGLQVQSPLVEPPTRGSTSPPTTIMGDSSLEFFLLPRD
jgi:hypothetical protein